MFTNRIFILCLIVAMVIGGALTFRLAGLSSALAKAGSEDHSYDTIENLRAERSSSLAGDHTYDDIERIRSTRGAASQVQSNPFGPGWAADYGTASQSRHAPNLGQQPHGPALTGNSSSTDTHSDRTY